MSKFKVFTFSFRSFTQLLYKHESCSLDGLGAADEAVSVGVLLIPGVAL